MARKQRLPAEGDPYVAQVTPSPREELRRVAAERRRARARRRRELDARFAAAGQPPCEGWCAAFGPEEPEEHPAAIFRRARCAALGAGRSLGPPPLAAAPSEQEGGTGVAYPELAASAVLAIFRALRAAGIKPHPWAESEGEPVSTMEDWEVANRIAAALRRADDDREPGVPESNLDPNHTFGVLNATSLLDGEEDVEQDGDTYTVTSQSFGYAWDVVVDIARMGGGLVRHPHQPDLGWYFLDHSGSADGDRFPAPADVLGAVQEDRWARMARFTLFTVVCYLTDVRLMGILFSYGPEAVPDLTLEKAINAEVQYIEDVTWVQFKSRLSRATPAHQGGPLYLCKKGWDEFYWRFDGDEGANTRAWGTGADGQAHYRQLFQRFCLFFWNSGLENAQANDYYAECARRKSLGAAAYGQAVGTFLAALDAVFRAIDPSITLADIVPTLEVGNEWDSTWFDYDTESDGTIADTSVNAARFGELARLMVMVSAPIRHQCPGIPFRFRFPDLLGWAADDPTRDWRKRAGWVQQVLTRGIVGVCERLARFQIFGPMPEATRRVVEASRSGDQLEAWLASCDAADFTWPTSSASLGAVDFVPAELVQEAGFHFWHATNSDGRYRDELRIQTDLVTWNELVIADTEVMASFGQLAWSVSGIQFQARAPDPPSEGRAARLGSYYTPNDEVMQAGMLARRLLFIKALGSCRVLWHTWMSNLEDKNTAWSGPSEHPGGQFKANGLRNDLYDSQPDIECHRSGPSGRLVRGAYPWPRWLMQFTRRQHAWRRPAWFTYRRLLWLMSQTSGVSIARSTNGLVVLRLFSRSGIGSPTAPAVPARYRFAWVAWIDQTSPIVYCTLVFPIGASPIAPSAPHAGWRVLSLVPAQDGTRIGAGSGWPEGDDNLDWLGSGMGQTTSTASAERQTLTLVVRRAGIANPAPICVLTDAATVSFGPTLVEGPAGVTPWEGPLDDWRPADQRLLPEALDRLRVDPLRAVDLHQPIPGPIIDSLPRSSAEEIDEIVEELAREDPLLIPQ